MFEAAEIRQMIDAAGPQLRAMILLGINCGYGNTDCASLAKSALDLDGGWVDFPRPKTGVGRRCPLWPETVSLMQAHLDARGNPGDAEPLFVNRRNQRLTRFGVRELLKRLHSTAEKTCSSLSRKGSGPHVFRHSAAIHLLRSGVETNVIKAWLGHASIETTARYIQIDIAMKHAALEKCDPMPAGPNGKEWRRTDEIIDWLKRL